MQTADSLEQVAAELRELRLVVSELKDKAKEMQATASDKVDEMRLAAADAIAPKKKRGILAFMR